MDEEWAGWLVESEQRRGWRRLLMIPVPVLHHDLTRLEPRKGGESCQQARTRTGLGHRLTERFDREVKYY